MCNIICESGYFYYTTEFMFSVISLCMHTYWIILILTLISTLIPTVNVPIYKFKYQSISYHYANHYLLDHYADYHLFYHYADHHMGTAFKF